MPIPAPATTHRAALGVLEEALHVGLHLDVRRGGGVKSGGPRPAVRRCRRAPRCRGVHVRAHSRLEQRQHRRRAGAVAAGRVQQHEGAPRVQGLHHRGRGHALWVAAFGRGLS